MFKKKIKNKIELLDEQELKNFIKANTEVVFIAPWNGKPMPVSIHMLDSVSLNSCGAFNTMSHVAKNEDEQITDLEQIIKTKNIHENILKLALVNPTFEQLDKHLKEQDYYINLTKRKDELTFLLCGLAKEIDKKPLQDELDEIELAIAFLIPEDFIASIIRVVFQREATDVQKLTRDTLLEAGFLGEKYNQRPSTFVGGTFTDKQRQDIDTTSLALVYDYREQTKVEKSGMRWIRGK